MSLSPLSFEVSFAIQWHPSPDHLLSHIPSIRPIATAINRLDSAGREVTKIKNLDISCAPGTNYKGRYQKFDLVALNMPKTLEIRAAPMCAGFPTDWMDRWTQDKLDETFYNGTVIKVGDRIGRLEADCQMMSFEEAGKVFLDGVLVTRPRICHYTIQ